jgi:hypothetical protein
MAPLVLTFRSTELAHHPRSSYGPSFLTGSQSLFRFSSRTFFL